MIGLSKSNPMEGELMRLVWHWIRATRASDAARAERELDQAVADTFPASDPVPTASAADRQPSVHEVECLLDCGSLTFIYGGGSERRAMMQGAGDAVTTLEGKAPDGVPMRISVRLPAGATIEGLQQDGQAPVDAPSVTSDGTASSAGTRSGGRSEGGSEAGLDMRPKVESPT